MLIGAGSVVEHRCPNTKPMFTQLQKMYASPQDRWLECLLSVPNIELDKWIQRAIISYNFYPWGALGVSRHQ